MRKSGRTEIFCLAALLILCAAVVSRLQEAAAQTPPVPVVGEIRIEIIDPPDKDPARWREIAWAMIFLKEGERFSNEKFSHSIQALESSALFQKIDIPDPDGSKDAIDLVFRLTPFARIKEIAIAGGFPLLEREIRNVLTIEAGDPFIPEAVADQRQYLAELFRKEGYIAPEISLKVNRDPEEGNVIIYIDIDKGRFFSIDHVDFTGNDAFSDLRLKIRLSTWQASLLFGGPSRFMAEDLEEDRQTLLDFYREQHYSDADVNTEVQMDLSNGTADISFNIDEGPLYELEINGNEFFWGFTLRKDVELFTRGNINDFGLRKSIRNIEKRYREAGFPDINVDVEDNLTHEGGRPVRSIRLKITEGPRYLVRRVSMEGNRALDDEEIKEQMLTAPPGWIADGPYVSDVLEEDIRAINTLYQQKGYLNAGIERVIDRKEFPESAAVCVDIHLRISEGPQTVVSDVAVRGLKRFDAEDVRKMLELSPGTPYRPNLLSESRINLAKYISERGYPHVSVEPEVDISPDQTAANIVFTVNEGPYVEMGQTFFIGNFRTRERTLRREMDLDENEPFSLEEMLASQRNIRDVNALESAQFQTVGLEEQAGRVDLLAKVNERKPYYLQFTTGYDTWRRFYVNTAAGDVNFMGMNQEVRASLEWSQIGYLAQLGITEPRLLGSRISATGNIFVEEVEEINQDFGVRTFGASAGFSRSFSSNLDGTLTLRYENREQYRTDDSPIPPEDADLYDPRSILVTTPSLVYTSTDSFIRPTRGIYSVLSVDISKGLQNSFDDFFKYRWDTRYYITPLEWFTIALRGRVGYIDPFGNESNIPEDQLFFLGGTTDVRGFSENRLRFDADGDPVGGRTSLLGSLEFRFDVGMNFELVTFYDTGAIRDPLIDAGSDEWRSGAGAGIRYVTAIGPIGLLHGWKLDKKDNESAGAWHFTIGYTF